MQVRHLRQVGEGLLVPVRVLQLRRAPVLRGHDAPDGAPGARPPAAAGAGRGRRRRRGHELRVPGVPEAAVGARLPVHAVRVLPPRQVRQGHGERALRARRGAAGEE